MSLWLWLLVDALASYRIARLVTTDTILHAVRTRLLAKFPPAPGKPGELIVCAWCCSVWIGLAVYAATRYIPHIWVWTAVPLALSAVAGYLSERA